MNAGTTTTTMTLAELAWVHFAANLIGSDRPERIVAPMPEGWEPPAFWIAVVKEKAEAARAETRAKADGWLSAMDYEVGEHDGCLREFADGLWADEPDVAQAIYETVLSDGRWPTVEAFAAAIVGAQQDRVLDAALEAEAAAA